MANSSNSRVCDTCGAPHAAGLVACAYCKTAYPGAERAGGMRCPRCGDMNAHGNTGCVSCQTPLVLGCVFCGHASPLDRAGCLRCGEAFAGAAERKRARDAQQQQQQTMHMAEEGIHVIGRVVNTPGVSSGLLGVFEQLIDAATKG